MLYQFRPIDLSKYQDLFAVGKNAGFSGTNMTEPGVYETRGHVCQEVQTGMIQVSSIENDQWIKWENESKLN